MKVGIITFHRTNNYGAMLQAYALQSKIKELGIECEIIDYRCKNIEKREMPPNIFSEGFFKVPIVLAFSIMKKAKIRKIAKFRNKNCQLSFDSYDRKTIGSTNSIYDCFIAGSDMIWELNVTGGDTAFLLDFVEEKKRVAFSSSFGYSIVPDQFVDITKKLLRRFDSISVREHDGQTIVKQLINKDVEVTLDPTMLFDKSFWRKKEEPCSIKDQYVLVYFNDCENVLLNAAVNYANSHSCKVVYISDSLKHQRHTYSIRSASIGQFLWLISHAVCVFTASFHGVVFSILYNTQFYYLNRSHSSRITSIIKDLNLEECEIKNDSCNNIINWMDINRRVSESRERAVQYLKTSLK